MLLRTAALSLALLALSGAARAQDSPGELVVVTKLAPPFVVAEQPGEWTGLSIELWRRIADDLDLEYRFEERDLAGLLDDVESGAADVAVAALTMTPERETRVDFTHTILTSGLGIAVGAADSGLLAALASALFSMEFLRAVGALGLVLFGIGLLVWLFERRRNPEEFGGTVARGLGEGFWWSAVTMTTVGYGDRSPRTLGGRLVGLVWMFASILLISGFTAAIASSLTVDRLDSQIRGADDLAGTRVGSLAGSTSAAWLEERRLQYETYPTPTAAVAALAAGELDAVVYDAPILSYLATGEFAGSVHVLPVRLERQDYAFALPAGSPLREPLNQALLEALASREWEALLQRYLGE